ATSPPFHLGLPRPPRHPLFPYTTLFRSDPSARFTVHTPTPCRRAYRVSYSTCRVGSYTIVCEVQLIDVPRFGYGEPGTGVIDPSDRKSTRLNSSHLGISYAVFCLKKKND